MLENIEIKYYIKNFIIILYKSYGHFQLRTSKNVRWVIKLFVVFYFITFESTICFHSFLYHIYINSRSAPFVGFPFSNDGENQRPQKKKKRKCNEVLFSIHVPSWWGQNCLDGNQPSSNSWVEVHLCSSIWWQGRHEPCILLLQPPIMKKGIKMKILIAKREGNLMKNINIC